MEEQWAHYRNATARAKNKVREECEKYNCYEWEIPIEMKKEKHKRKEILPYVKMHLQNDVFPSDTAFIELVLKHKLVDEEYEGEIVIEELDWFNDKPVAFLEELLQLQIQINRTRSNSVRAHQSH